MLIREKPPMKNVTVIGFCVTSNDALPNSASNSLRSLQVPVNRLLFNLSGLSYLGAGRCQEAQTSCENFSLFPFFPRDLCDSLIDAPLFSISWCRTFWSAPVTHQVQGCGRCPLRAAISRPWQSCCPRKLSVPRRVQGYRITDPLALPVRGPTLLWLMAWASIESQHRQVVYMIRDGIASKSDPVVVNQPVQPRLTIPSQPLNFSFRQTPW